MNKTESRYAEHLRLRFVSGEVLYYGFEALKLRLAKRTFYSPDFLVVTASGLVELHEVKGHWEDDARVKIKTAAEQFPFFSFVAVKAKGDGWEIEAFEPFGERGAGE